jgi:hypothetical protein
MKIPFTTDLFLEASLKAIMDPRLARCGFDATQSMQSPSFSSSPRAAIPAFLIQYIHNPFDFDE